MVTQIRNTTSVMCEKRATLRPRITVAILIGAVCLVQTLVYSICLPGVSLYLLFREDENLRLTQGQLGVIMGATTGITVLIQPVIGRLLVSAVSDKTMLTLGLVLNAAITALKSLVDVFDNSNHIFIFTVICHPLASIGHSMSSVAIYAALGNYLSDINHIMLPMFDILFGLAMVLGPLIGGPLYNAAGIVAVFLFAAGLCLLTAIFILFLYPSKRTEVKGGRNTPSKADYSILFNVPVIVNIVIIAHCYCMMLYNDVTLANRLKRVMMHWESSRYSFAVFGVAGAAFAGLGVVFGFLSKRIPDMRIFVLIALPIGAIAWLLISCVFFFEAELLWMFAGQFLLGISMSPMYVCCYFYTLKYLKGHDDPGVYAIVSGAFNPAANLGGSVGQFMSEFLRFPSERSWLPAVGTDCGMIILNFALTAVLALTMCFGRR